MKMVQDHACTGVLVLLQALLLLPLPHPSLVDHTRTAAVPSLRAWAHGTGAQMDGTQMGGKDTNADTRNYRSPWVPTKGRNLC